MGDSRSTSAFDEHAWDLLVDAALPVVWDAIHRWHVNHDDMQPVCQVVFGRVFEMLAARRQGAPDQPSVIGAVRAIAIEECERARRLSAWYEAGEQRATVTYVVDPTAHRATHRVLR